MATLKEVRQALATTLTTYISDLNVSPLAVGAVTPPHVVIVPSPFDYLKVFGNKVSDFEFMLDIFAGTDEQFAQDKLDELVDGEGARSIVDVLTTYPLVGVTGCSVKGPIRLAHYGTLTAGNTNYIGARITLGVVVTRA